MLRPSQRLLLRRPRSLSCRGSAAKRPLLRIFQSNITVWNHAAESYFQHAFAKGEIDVALISETHLDADGLLQLKGWAEGCRLAAFPSEARVTDKGGTTGGVLCLLPRHYDIRELGSDQDHRALQIPLKDDWSAVRLQVKGFSIMVVSLYLTHGLGPKGPNLARMVRLATFLSMCDCPYIIGADWNCIPSELNASGWVQGIQGHILHLGDVSSTCFSMNGRLIDYFVVHGSLVSWVASLEVVQGTPWRPHLSQLLQVRATPAEKIACMLQSPASLPVVQGPDLQDSWETAKSYAEAALKMSPLGIRGLLPAIMSESLIFHVVHSQASAISKRFAAWYLALESYYARRAGATDSWRSYGRGQFPRLIRGPIQAKQPKGIVKLSHATVCLMGIETRLKELKVHRTRGNGHRQCVAIASFVAHTTPKLRAQGHVLDQSLECRASVLSLNPGQLEAVCQEVSSEASKSRAIDYAQSRASFKKWIFDHSSGGAGALHKWTARTTAIPPLATSAIEDGLARNTPDEMMGMRARLWDGYWGRGGKDKLARNVGNLMALRDEVLRGPAAPLIDIPTLKRALGRFHDSTGRGTDAWSPDLWKAQPPQSMIEMCDILNECRHSMLFPAQLYLVRIALNPKPKGGERPIAMLTLLFRLCARLDRAEWVVQWEASHARHWDFAVAGSSALRGAISRALRAEAAAEEKLEFGEVLWDLTKFYDTVDWGALLDHAVLLGIPPHNPCLGWHDALSS